MASVEQNLIFLEIIKSITHVLETDSSKINNVTLILLCVLYNT